MTTFDGWEAQLYGDVMALPSGDELMHFRTKGSKNGVRRYQTESGEWTPLGLKERAAREGWEYNKKSAKYTKKASKAAQRGDGKKASLYTLKRNRAGGVVSNKEYRAIRKLDRKQNKAERRGIMKERISSVKKALQDKRNKNSLKNLTDAELQQRINRAKKEIEYKELTKNPLLKAGEKLVTGYFENKDKKLDREIKRAELMVRQQEAKQKTLASKAALSQARGNIIDNIMRGSKYKTAQTNLINAKADKTIRGALRKAASKVIEKEGDRFVNEMGDKSLVMRGGRKIKNTVEKGREKTVDALKKYYAQDEKAIAEKKRKKQNKRDRKIGQELRG